MSRLVFMLLRVTEPCPCACAVLQELDVQLHDCREQLLHHKDSLQADKTKEKDLISQVSKSKSTITNLEGELRKLEQEMIKQQMTMSEQANKNLPHDHIHATQLSLLCCCSIHAHSDFPLFPALCRAVRCSY